VHKNDFKFEEHRVASLLPKSMNSRVTKLLEKAKQSNPRNMLRKLLQDSDNLEKYYSDKEYRRRLVSSSSAAGGYYFPSYSSEYFELENIYEQDRKLKEKLNLPENCTIRYEQVKCSKDCRHNTHRYYYAYIWDCNSKKLKKKYIGKYLPLLCTTTTII